MNFAKLNHVLRAWQSARWNVPHNHQDHRRNDHFFTCSSISIRRRDLLASKNAPRGLVEGL